jgi:signal transduction histidine kinase
VEGERDRVAADATPAQRDRWVEGWPHLVRTLGSDVDFTQLCRIVCRSIVDGFGFSRALIATVDEQNCRLVGRAGYAPHIPQRVYMALLRLYHVPLAPEPDGRLVVAAWCVARQQQAYVPDASRDSFRPGETTQRAYIIKALGTTEYVLTPIVYGGRAIAVLGVDKKGQPDRFHAAELALLESIAALLAVRFGPLLQAMGAIDVRGRAAGAGAEPGPPVVNRGSGERDELFESVLHDLKAPLQSIVGFAELLQLGRGGDLTPEQMEYVSRIEAGGEELIEYIERLLSARALDAGDADLSSGSVVAARLVDDVFERLNGKALRARVRLQHDLNGDIPPLTGDAWQFEAVFQNLIDNAIDAARPGVTVRVRAALQGDGRHTCFTITGEGGAAEDRPAVAGDPQAGGGRRRRSHGLGLTIVQRVVEAYGGELWAEGRVGRDLAITFTLPVAPQPAEPLPSARESR